MYEMKIVSPEEFHQQIHRKHLSSCVLLPYKGKYLIVKKKISQRWSLPGGIMNENESPDQTAIRECQEEIGITPAITRLFHVYYSMPVVDIAPKKGDSVHFVFLGAPLSEKQIDSIYFSDGEVEVYDLIEQNQFPDFIQENLGRAIIEGFWGNKYSCLQRSLSSLLEEERRYRDFSDRRISH